MAVSVKPLLNDFHSQSEKLNKEKKKLKELERQSSLLQNLKQKISRDFESQKSLDWNEGKNKELLDRLYELDRFQFHEKIYKFKSPNEIQPLLKDIDAYGAEQHQKLYQQRDVTEKNQSQLMAYHDQILQIINKLSQCMSSINR